jgi:hypothetical protein
MKKYKAIYKQGYRSLVDNCDCFCVMGVACNESETDLEWEQGLFDGIWHIGKECDLLPKKIQKEYGFHSPAGSRRDGNDLVIGGRGYESLMDANDNGVSFEDLADYIEKNYKYL